MKIYHWICSGLLCLTASQLAAQESKTAAAAREPIAGVAKDVVLDPPANANAKQEAVNVRGQVAFAGEVVAHLKKGQTVSVLEQLTLAKPKSDEPAAWSRIALPADASVYVFADYVDTNTMTVSSRTRINLRGGPGENYSILGRLDKGAPVKVIRQSQNWLQIEPPTNSYGFVASEYLVLQPPAPPPPAATTSTTSTTSTSTAAPEPVATPPAAVPPPTMPQPAPIVTNPPPPEPIPTNTPPPTAPPPAAPAPTAPPVAPPAAPAPEPAPADATQRIVTREGIVRKTLDPHGATDYELKDVQTGEVTEFLLTSEPKFKVYLGARVLVTGPELIDPRWPKTPILQVKTIFLTP